MKTRSIGERSATGGRRRMQRCLLFSVFAVAIFALGASALFASGQTEAAAKSASPKVSIQFLNIGPDKQVTDLFNQKIDPAFEAKYPNVTVTPTSSDWGSAFQKVTTGIAAGTASDVMVIGGIWVAPLAGRNGLLPLDKMVAQMPNRKDYYAAAWKDCQYQGHTYAVPFDLDARALIYRKDLYSQVGLNPDNPAQTWAQYLADAKKLTKFQGGQMVRAGTLIGLDTSIGIQQYFAQLFFQAGGSYYKSNGQANFNSPAGRKAAQLIEELLKEKATSPNFITPNGSASPITLGTAAMQFNGVAAIQNARDYAPTVVNNLGIGEPLKMDSSSTPATVVWVDKVAIYKGTKHPKQAWDYASFITSPKWDSQWAHFDGNLPANTVAASDPFWAKDQSAHDLLAAMKYAHVQPANPHMFQIPHIIKNELMDMIYGKVTPDQAVKLMDTKIDAVLAQ